jgi:hypothetical protein
VEVAPPLDAYDLITETVPTTITTTPNLSPSVRTLVLYSADRLNQFYTAGDIVTTSQLLSKLQILVAHPDVAGVLVNLDDYPALGSAYARWDRRPESPALANFVALHIKSLLYRLAPAYPELQYLVLVGGDRIIPQRRLRDATLIANERRYAGEAQALSLRQSLQQRYMLSDDYYTGLLPLPWRGRELYLPHLAVGRLVESPGEIATAIDTYLRYPELQPENAMVTGYDFLIDQALVISATLRSQGITNLGG